MATDKLKAIRVFRRVAELGSFTKAAEDLGITAATVSKHIAYLEGDLEARLINRTTRRMHLTDTGLNFLSRAQSILDDLEDAEMAVKGLQAAPQGRIRINAPMSFGLTHLTEAIDSFLNQYPQIEVDLQLNDHVVDLVEQGVDVAIRIRSHLSDSSLIAKPLRSSRNVICASPRYLEAWPAITKPSDLTAHNCLLYTLHDKPTIWQLGGEEIQVSGRYKADSSLALKASILTGLGVGFVPRFLVQSEIEQQLLVPLLEDFPAKTYTIFAIFPPGRKQPGKVKLLIEHLNKHLGNQPYWD